MNDNDLVRRYDVLGSDYISVKYYNVGIENINEILQCWMEFIQESF